MAERMERCERCYFWERCPDGADWVPPASGWCHRNAPMPRDKTHTHSSDWPITDVLDWCGEFKPADRPRVSFDEFTQQVIEAGQKPLDNPSDHTIGS